MAASTQPFDVGLVIARLRNGLPKMLQVGGAADYASIAKLRDYRPPCAYVLLGRERGRPVESGSNIPNQQTRQQQVLVVTFGVVMVFQNKRQLQGDELRDELRDEIGQVRALLFGWTPPVTCGKACEIAEGDLVDFDAGIAMWTDVWRTQHSIDNKNAIGA